MRPTLLAIAVRAMENCLQSPFISREEAIARVGPIADRPWDRYYRADP